MTRQDRAAADLSQGTQDPTKEVLILQLAKNSVGRLRLPGETRMLQRTVTGDQSSRMRGAKDD